MSVSEINQLHRRYLELSDRFKALWTYHQFAKSAYENLVSGRLPYEIDFKGVWDPIKQAQEQLRSTDHEDVRRLFERSGRQLDQVTGELMKADAELSPTIMRRFFEKLARQDEQIIFNLIKFYLYARETEGDQRDKLDYLLTRIGESELGERGEYAARESIELRQRLEALSKLLDDGILVSDDVVGVIRKLREIKNAIDRAQRFEDLTEQDLMEELRAIKKSAGSLFFHPDVMLAIVQANIAMKQKFARLYEVEEQRILKSADRILSNEQFIRESSSADPGVADEINRFRELKQELDRSRAGSNVKHAAVTRIKESLYRILGEEGGAAELIRDSEPVEEESAEQVLKHFGDDEVYLPELRTMVRALSTSKETSASVSDVVSNLRLEPWELEAFLRTSRSENTPGSPEANRDLLFLRGAALRMRISNEAKMMLEILNGSETSDATLLQIRATLKEAELADADFAAMINDMKNRVASHELRWLHRSRIRLFRDFAGLWLIYDQYVTNRDDAPGPLP